MECGRELRNRNKVKIQMSIVNTIATKQINNKAKRIYNETRLLQNKAGDYEKLSDQ